MDLLTYSPEDVVVLIANVLPLSGMAEGTFVQITKNTPAFSVATSADGVVRRTYRDEQVYTLEVTLQQTSPSNELLSKMMIADYTTRSIVFPLFIKDSTGGFIFQAMKCWIVSTPDVTFSDEMSERVWEFCCTGVSINVGGNDSDLGLLGDLGNLAFGALPNLGLF